MPANVRHVDGKRHVNTVPVRLLTPQNSGRKAHEDRAFARAVVEQVEEFACLFDEELFCFISQGSGAAGLTSGKKTNINSDAS